MKNPETPSDIFEFKRNIRPEEAAKLAYHAGYAFFAASVVGQPKRVYAVACDLDGIAIPGKDFGTLDEVLASMEDRSSIAAKAAKPLELAPFDLRASWAEGIGSFTVIDGFYENPEATRSRALAGELTADPERHKGLRSPDMKIPEQVAVALATITGKPIGKGYTCFQLNTAGDQLVHHSDTQRWAAAVYLTPDAPPEAGLSFYRSRGAKGVRSSIDLPEFARVAGITPKEAEAIVYGGRLLDRTAWQEVDRIGNVFNRLVVWDARLVHAVSETFGFDAEHGRLAQLFFWD